MKRKFIRCLVGGIVLVMAVTNLSGCTSTAQKKQQAAEALEKKYQEEFEIVNCRNAGFAADYYMVQAYAKEYPELLFEASVDNETKSVMDSYVTKRLCNRISEKISWNLAALQTDYYVFTEALIGDTVLTDPMVALEDYMKEAPGNKFTIYLCMDEQNADAQNIVTVLKNMLDDISGINGSIVFFLPNAELLLKIQEYVVSHDDTYDEFDKMVEDAYIGSVKVENGSFILTEENLKKMAGDRL